MNKKSTLRSVANDYLTHPNGNKGITLIALVVTIIVLLILAGISISMLSGDNSILQRATTAKENTDSSQIQERINLAYHSSLVDGQGKVTETSLENEIKKEFDKDTLDEGWLDKNSVKGKWKITIDNVTLEVPAGVETQNSPLDVLIGKTKKDILFNSSISIDSNTNAKFYDSDFNTCDDYIEYDEKIYRISYNIDYDSLDENAKEGLIARGVDVTGKTPGEVLSSSSWNYMYPFRNFVVNNISLTNYEIASLGINQHNITTIVHGTKQYSDTDTVYSIESYLFDDNIGSSTKAFAYSSNGILVAYPDQDDLTYYHEDGWIPWFDLN